MILRLALLALCSVTSLFGAERRQEQAPAFKSGGVTVPVYATVSDLNHRLVTNLSAEDFTVFDNGRPRPITVFEKNVLPISVVLLLDASESMRASIGLLRAAAKQFVANLLPSDRVLLGAFNENIRWVRPFTNNQNTLNLALDYFGPKKVDYGTALWPAMNEGIRNLSSVDGRKVLLVFSDGEGNWGNNLKLTTTVRAITENVMVYAITIQTTYLQAGRPVRSTLDPDLPKLTADTGGGYFELTTFDDLGTTFARVAAELHSQYTIGFDAPELDGQTHTATVEVRRDGLTTRGRRRYVATQPK